MALQYEYPAKSSTLGVVLPPNPPPGLPEIFRAALLAGVCFEDLDE
jgi:hypothetical protein